MVIFEDASAVLTTTAAQCTGVTPREIRCLSTGLSRLTAQLGGGDDSFRLDDTVTTVAAIAAASIDGGDGNDALTSGAASQVLFGGDGDDALRAGADDDALLGGSGKDSLDGGDSRDTLDGGADNDLLTGADGDDTLHGGAEWDVLNDGPGNDRVFGDGGDDYVYGGPGSDRVDGGPGDDLVEGGLGRDRVVGGPGTDLLRTRDGISDVVDCGGGGDLAIVDPVEAIKNCHRIRIDRGLRLRPPFRQAARAVPERGTVRLPVEGADTFYPLQDVADIPLRSALDTSDGTAGVITTKRLGGTVQEASLRGGEFTVHQVGTTARPFTELRLTGGDIVACHASGRGSARQVRQLETRIGKRRGKYRVRGRHSIGAAFGTTWLTVDRCDGTLTRVVTGAVLVRDFARHRVVAVHAGHSYLARAR